MRQMLTTVIPIVDLASSLHSIHSSSTIPKPTRLFPQYADPRFQLQASSRAEPCFFTHKHSHASPTPLRAVFLLSASSGLFSSFIVPESNLPIFFLQIDIAKGIAFDFAEKNISHCKNQDNKSVRMAAKDYRYQLYQASKDNVTVYAALSKAPSAEYVNVSRWYKHIDALLRIS
ncbi:elongation factor 1-delta-like [Senna tora]|uniref:Elongation factor 1-delta-like n=1 Tax=Senna tora TaxID=362788 RepID=A0A835C5C4_9FABA|nr:elongation factor 1-delta-like [Senna tora]